MRIKQKITSVCLAFLLLVPVLASAIPARAAGVSGWDLATEGQRNIVRRAYQMTEIKWTPLADVTGWKSKIVYKAGTTYKGLPYSQPLKGKYVPYKATLDEFAAAVKDPNSQLYQLYKDSQNSNITMPYYGADCSSFVGWAWNVSRGPTTSLPGYATKLSSYKDAMIGDGLIKVGDHATIITDITYDASGNITKVEVCDANAYTSGSTQVYWCQRKSYTLDKFLTKFINKGYAVYRVKNYQTVPYTHSCAVPLEGDSCAKCGLNYYKETPCSFGAIVDMSATLYSLPNGDSPSSGILFGGSALTVKAYHVADDGTIWYKTTDDSWIQADRVTTDCPHSYSETVIQSPTCTQPGSSSFTCGSCMHSYVKTVAKLGHSYRGGTCIRCSAVLDPGTIAPGDVDGSGAVDTDDAVYLLLHTMFGDTDYPIAGAAVTDLDGSGKTDTDDAVYLLLHAMFGPGDYPLAA